MYQHDALNTILYLKESWKENRCEGDMSCGGCECREDCERFSALYDYVLDGGEDV